MSENEEVPAEAEGEAAPKKGKKKLVIIAAAVLLLVIIGGVLASGVMGGGKKAEHEGTEEQATEEEHASEEGGKGEEGGHGEKEKPNPNKPVYYELPQFLVNLNTSTGKVSFIKMSVTLELKSQKALTVVDASKPRIVDTFNTYLRELRASDVQGSAGVYRLRDELLARLNATLEGEPVKDVLFSEIIIQ